MVTWQQQSTKSSAKDVNLGTITDTLSWCKFSPLSGIRVKPKLHRRRTRIYESFQKPSQKPKVINTDNSLEFGKHCEELPWNYRTTTPHRPETSGIAGRCIWEIFPTMRNFRAGLWTSEQRVARRQRIPHARCSASRKSKQPNFWMTSHSKINNRPRFPWLRRIGFDDDVSIEKVLR